MAKPHALEDRDLFESDAYKPYEWVGNGPFEEFFEGLPNPRPTTVRGSRIAQKPIRRLLEKQARIEKQRQRQLE